MDRIYIRCLWK